MIAGVLPAAGLSRRMGRPKLILPVGGISLIARVLTALREGGVSVVVVVTPPRDTPGALPLIREAEGQGAIVIVPDHQPADMRASVEIAIAELEKSRTTPSILLLAPADSPGMTAATVGRVVDRARAEPDRIILPSFGGKRGHPVALPWNVARAVRDLPAGVGVNALIALHADGVVELAIDDPGVIADLDTPEDYRRWSGGE